MTVYTHPDKRFHRAHLKPSRRRRDAVRRRLLMHVVTIAVALTATMYWGVGVARHTPVLSVKTITVSGNNRLSTGEVLALVATLRGQNIFSADLTRGRASLLTSGWVEDATLRRILPSAIEVTVEEREPVGLGRFGSQLYLIDHSGRIIDEFGPRFADFDLPIIDGLIAHNSTPGVQVDNRRAALASRLLGDIGADTELAPRISQVDVGDPHDAVVLLNGDQALIHLGEDKFAERLQTYLELKPSLQARVPDIDYVDLRFDRRVYVRPVGQDDLSEVHVHSREGLERTQ